MAVMLLPPPVPRSSVISAVRSVRRSRSDADDLVRRIARRFNAGEQGRLPALRMAPYGETLSSVRFGDLLRGANGIEHRMRLAVPTR